jgi:uncharacterized protein (TIGR02145 family)
MAPFKFKAIINIRYFSILFSLTFLFPCTLKAQKVINEYARIVSIFNADTTNVDSVRVDASVFEQGDTVLFIDMKGVEVYTPDNAPGFPAFWGLISNPNNTGIYNILLVYKVSGDIVVFTTKLRQLKPVKPGEVSQLVKISGGKDVCRIDEPLTCAPWDPVKGTGGVFALIAGRKIVINNTIDLSGKGFTGGNPNSPSVDYFTGSCSEAIDSFYTETAVDSSGRKGESIVYEGFPYTRGTLYVTHGGGGGNGKYSGGGGGGNYGPGGKAGQESESCLPGKVNLGGLGKDIANRYYNEGYFPNRIFMGGGGGTGTQNPDSGRFATKGGNGGGIIILITDTIEATGTQIVRSRGGDVTDTASAGAGGGGGGGVIILDANKYIGSLNFDVRGGNGGWTNHSDPTGPGGFGGAGAVWHAGSFKLSTLTGVTINIDNGDPGQHIVEGLRDAAKKSTLKGTVINNLSIPLSGFLFNVMPDNQSICEGDTPSLFIASFPKGGDGPGTYTYRWIQSFNKINWTDAPVPNTDKDYSSGPQTDTIYFCRIVYSGTTIDTSRMLTINVHPYPPMHLTLTSSSTSSIGGTDGSIDLQLTGGSPPYALLWSNGQTTNNITGLSAGIYSITISDSKDSTITDSIRVYDTFTDERDGSRYKVITIGQQIWMAENLNIGQRIINTQNQADNQIFEKFCYDNDDAQCDTFGGLYQWDEMMQYTQTESSQGICPSGWHIPGDEEWKTMEIALDMTQDEADNWEQWRGIDQGIQIKPGGSTGFEALFAGYRYWSDYNFINQGISGYFWSSTNGIDYTTNSINRAVDPIQPGIWRNEDNKENGYSVRCVTSVCDLFNMTLADSIINVSCNGQSNGEAHITVEGGIPPYSFLWSNSFTTSFINNIPAGLYSVIVSDSNKCEKNTYLNITEPAPLVLSFKTTNLVCIGDSNGVITANVIGGTVPYIYQWNNGETTKEITGLSAKIYSIIITDSEGCIVIGAESVAEPPPVVTSEITGPVQVDANDISIYSVNKVTGSTFNWIVTGGNIVSGQGTDIINISWGAVSPGDISVVETNKSGCVGSPVEIQISINPVSVSQQSSRDLKIYPNPVNDNVFIHFPNSFAEVYKLILTDLSGKICKEIDNITSNELNLETGELPGGIYFIELRGTKIYRSKIIVE